MHIYFVGIGGAGIGPLALIAQQAGYQVSGSDKQNSLYIEYLKKHGLKDIAIGQSRKQISLVHAERPIDWLVYSSAVPAEQPDHPELAFARDQKIKVTRRDQFLNQILKDQGLELIAIAGTHGKTTTTAMVVWLFRELGLPLSYLLPAKTSFADMGHFDSSSRYFVYEADEFDRNFLSFKPQLSLISGVSYDHHEIYPTRDDYRAAFREFISQSALTFIWQDDYDYLGLSNPTNLIILNDNAPLIKLIPLKGQYNRLDAWLATAAMHRLSSHPVGELIKIIGRFPGLQRRLEEIIPGLYSDYAHTPEKIRGAMSAALETAAAKHQAVVVIYEPLTDRRQHYLMDEYKDCFNGAAKLYWLPSYLAREDPALPVLPPRELITHLNNPEIAEPAERNSRLKAKINEHLNNGDMVVGMAGGGGGSLDEWLRANFSPR